MKKSSSNLRIGPAKPVGHGCSRNEAILAPSTARASFTQHSSTLDQNSIMKNLLTFLALSFCLLSFSAIAKEPDARMTVAIERLVESQQLEKLWPLITEGSAATGAARVERSARARVDEITGLSPAQLSIVNSLIAGTSASVAAEIADMHRKLPVNALVREMAYAVYTKYFTAKEIEDLANFYAGAPFQKLARLQIELSDEVGRTGRNRNELQAKYMARMTAPEMKAMMAFGESSTGKKQQQIGATLAADMRAYLRNQTDAEFEEIMLKYEGILAAKLQAAFAP